MVISKNTKTNSPTMILSLSSVLTMCLMIPSRITGSIFICWRLLLPRWCLFLISSALWSISEGICDESVIFYLMASMMVIWGHSIRWTGLFIMLKKPPFWSTLTDLNWNRFKLNWNWVKFLLFLTSLTGCRSWTVFP